MDRVCWRVQPSGLWDWTWLVSLRLPPSPPLPLSPPQLPSLLRFLRAKHVMSPPLTLLLSSPSFLFFFSLSLLPPRPPWHLAVLRGKRRPYERGHIFIRATCLGLVAKGTIFWCSVKQCVCHESLLLEFLWLFFKCVTEECGEKCLCSYKSNDEFGGGVTVRFRKNEGEIQHSSSSCQAFICCAFLNIQALIHPRLTVLVTRKTWMFVSMTVASSWQPGCSN